MSAERLMAIADPVIYADGFDCALRIDEVHRGVRAAVEPAELEALLKDRPGLGDVLAVRDGYVCLRGREELIDQRPARVERARRLRRRAARVAQVLGGFPFVRGLALTGSVAADDADAGADVDLMVVVEPGRIGTVFLVLGTLARLTGRRFFCPNYYVAEGELGFEPDGAYLDHELLHSVPLEGAADRLRPENAWLHERFPNAGASPEPAVVVESRLRRAVQRALERPLRGRQGDRLERKAGEVAISRLGSHHRIHRSAAPSDVVEAFRAGQALRFHGSGERARADSAYAERRAEVAAALETALANGGAVDERSAGDGSAAA